jgi:hypothetical protein
VKKSLLPTLLALAAITGLACYVWPTRYRYDHLKIGPNEYPIRTDRLSGETEIFYPTGWIKREPHLSQPDVELPPWEVAALQTTGQMEFDSVKVQVYNGSKSQVSEISVSISIFDAKHNPVISNRVYRLTPSYSSSDLSPQSSGEFTARTGFDFEPTQTWEFSVVGAKGRTE